MSTQPRWGSTWTHLPMSAESQYTSAHTCPTPSPLNLRPQLEDAIPEWAPRRGLFPLGPGDPFRGWAPGWELVGEEGAGADGLGIVPLDPGWRYWMALGLAFSWAAVASMAIASWFSNSSSPLRLAEGSS